MLMLQKQRVCMREKDWRCHARVALVGSRRLRSTLAAAPVVFRACCCHSSQKIVRFLISIFKSLQIRSRAYASERRTDSRGNEGHMMQQQAPPITLSKRSGIVQLVESKCTSDYLSITNQKHAWFSLDDTAMTRAAAGVLARKQGCILRVQKLLLSGYCDSSVRQNDWRCRKLGTNAW